MLAPTFGVELDEDGRCQRRAPDKASRIVRRSSSSITMSFCAPPHVAPREIDLGGLLAVHRDRGRPRDMAAYLLRTELRPPGSWNIIHIVEHNARMRTNEPPTLGEFEQLVLLALVHLGDEAYGASVRRAIETRAGRELAISAVYTTLERLEQKGLVRSSIGEPTPQRGGRRRKYFTLLPLGARALKIAYNSFTGMTAGLEQRLRALR